MTIAAKLRIVSALPVAVIVVILILGVVGYVSASDVWHIAEDASALEDNTFALNPLSYDYIRHPSDEAAARWLEQYTSLEVDLSHAGKHFYAQRHTGALVRSAHASKETFTRLVQNHGRDQRLAEKLVDEVRESHHLASHIRARARTRLGSIIEHQILWALVALLVVGSGISILTIWTGHRISAGLRAFRCLGQTFAAGNLDCRIDLHSDDEFGQLARVCNQMAAHLGERQTQLQDSAAYNRSLLEANLDPMVVVNPEGMVTDLNRAAEEATGKDRASLIGTFFAPHFTDPEYALTKFREVLSKGFSVDIPLAVRHSSGRVIEFLTNASVYRDREGNVAGVVAAGHDITERKKAEQTLQESEARLRTILNYLPVGILLLNRDGSATTTNPAFERIWGVSGTMDPERYHERKAWEAESGEPIRPNEWASARALERGDACFNEMLEIEGFDGVRRTVLNSAVPLRDAQGEITGAIAVFQDITELQRAERALNELNRKLECSLAELRNTQQQVVQSEKLAALGTMAAGIAHELANPLMGVMNYVDDASELASDPKIQSALGSARRVLQRMRDLLRGMLNFARPIEEKPAMTSVADIIARTLDLTASEWKALGITIETDIEPDLPLITCKPGGLQQVLLNVLFNARDAIQGRPQKLIRVSATRSDGLIRIQIADTGHGVPAELGQKIFDPFVTTKEPGKGTGLGLSVSHSIVADMGGTIGFTSKEGEGTVFTVTLPAGMAMEGQG